MRPLDMVLLGSRILQFPRFNRVEYFTSIGSTNAVAVERLYHNDCFGISFVTESQTEGRGRAGRSWVSPPGAGLLASTILPSELPPKALPAVGFWAALAVRAAVQAQTGLRLELKWPNDLLLAGLKCVGILAQGRARAQSSRVVVGVGVNVNRPEAVPAKIGASAAWLSDPQRAPVDRTALLEKLLARYEQTYDGLLSAPKRIIDEWAAAAALTSKQIVVRALDGSVLHEGIVRALDDEGSLILQTAAGERTVRLGDVEVLS